LLGVPFIQRQGFYFGDVRADFPMDRGAADTEKDAFG
jgi:hypothetical protein